LPWSSPIFLSALAVMLLIIVGMAAMDRGLHSELELWMLLMLWGWFLEMALIALPAPSYTTGWYAARMLGLVSGLFVLFALLAETSTLYVQTVLQLIAEKQEREHRFLVRDVVSASIAHEVRNPLAAVALNAEFVRDMASGTDKDWSAPKKVLQVLDEIVADSHRAKKVIESTLALFRRENDQRAPIDAVSMLQGALALIANRASTERVSVELRVEGKPGLIIVNKLQVQQALLNLFQNAIDALSQSDLQHRMLLVHCSRWEDQGLVIRVEDNGPGIALGGDKSVFETFVTTRPDGTGLGLIIANTVIRAHGGSLEVEARSPKGTAFTIRLHDGTAERQHGIAVRQRETGISLPTSLN
jgi:signal transduction histidine kinase